VKKTVVETQPTPMQVQELPGTLQWGAYEVQLHTELQIGDNNTLCYRQDKG
jgi:hypothetical protein